MELVYRNNILSCIKDEDSFRTINWLLDINFLHKNHQCHLCKETMYLSKTVINEIFSCMWVCKKCPLGASSFSDIERGTIFEMHSLPLQQWLLLILLWGENERQDDASKKVSISNTTVGKIFRKFRKICEEYFKYNPLRFEGTGQTLLFERNLYKIGKILIDGIIDSGTNPPVGYLTLSEGKKIKTKELHDIVEHLKISSHIIPNKLRTTDHASIIRLYKDKHSKIMYGRVNTENYISCVNQAMWLDRFGDQPCFNLMQHIKQYYSYEKFKV